MAGRIEARLTELGITLPPPARALGSYVPYVRTGNQVWITQGPILGDELHFEGKLGREFGVEEGRACARMVILNVITCLRQACGGDLDRVVRAIRCVGVMNATDDFTQHSQVMNGASDLLVEIFGEKGRHARLAYGCSSLPADLAVDIEAIFEVET